MKLNREQLRQLIIKEASLNEGLKSDAAEKFAIAVEDAVKGMPGVNEASKEGDHLTDVYDEFGAPIGFKLSKEIRDGGTVLISIEIMSYP